MKLLEGHIQRKALWTATSCIPRLTVALHDWLVYTPTEFLFPVTGILQDTIDQPHGFLCVKGMKVGDTCFGEGLLTGAAHSPPTSLSRVVKKVEDSFDRDSTHRSLYPMRIINNPLVSISYATEKL